MSLAKKRSSNTFVLKSMRATRPRSLPLCSVFASYASGQDPRRLRLSVGARVHAAAAAFGCWLAFQFHGSRSATLLAG
jgi:hypothetical protein